MAKLQTIRVYAKLVDASYKPVSLGISEKRLHFVWIYALGRYNPSASTEGRFSNSLLGIRKMKWIRISSKWNSFVNQEHIGIHDAARAANEPTSVKQLTIDQTNLAPSIARASGPFFRTIWWPGKKGRCCFTHDLSSRNC